MSSLHLNSPKKRSISFINWVLFIIIIFLFCLVFYGVNNLKDESKTYKKENQKYEEKVTKLEKQVKDLNKENKTLQAKTVECTKLDNKKFTLKDGVYIEFTTNGEFKDVNGTIETTNKYTFKDNVVTYLVNNIPFYYVISKDCINLYKINYETNEMLIYKAN